MNFLQIRDQTAYVVDIKYYVEYLTIKGKVSIAAICALILKAAVSASGKKA